MEVKKTNIKDCFEITPKIIEDKRGYFFESFNLATFETHTGIKPFFVQDNQSFSKKGTLRGLHFQRGKHVQAKLVSVLDGEVLDVVVDLRPDSMTFKKVVRIKLSSKNKKQLFIPRGCAHGFVTLSDTATFFYKCDNFYHESSETGIIYNDSELNINWIFEDSDLIISTKDKTLPTLKQLIAI